MWSGRQPPLPMQLKICKPRRHAPSGGPGVTNQNRPCVFARADCELADTSSMATCTANMGGVQDVNGARILTPAALILRFDPGRPHTTV